MTQRTTDVVELERIVEKMQELVDERSTLAERSKRAKIDGKFVKRAVADDRIRVIDRKLGWYRGRVPADMHPVEVVQLWKEKEAAAQAKREAEAEAKHEAEAEAKATTEPTTEPTTASDWVDGVMEERMAAEPETDAEPELGDQQHRVG